MPPTRCMTLAVSLQLPRASVSPGQAFGASVLRGGGALCCRLRFRERPRCVCMEEMSHCHPMSELCHVLVPWGP